MKLKKYICHVLILLIISNFLIIPGNISNAQNSSTTDNIVDVQKDYDAVGDGVTDDVQAIQNAINACDGENMTTVYIPSGLYCISSPLNLSKSNVKLLGDEDTKIICNFGDHDTFKNKTNKETAAIYCHSTVKTGNICNVAIENISIDVGLYPSNNNDTTLGRGISFARTGKDNCELKNISIKNCRVENAYSYGIIAVGKGYLKEQYSDVKDIYDELSGFTGDFDSRMYYDYYDVEDISIINCFVDNCRIGIRLNAVNNVKVKSNFICNSILENLTLQGQNIECYGNTVYSHFGGCGNIALDRCVNIKIKYNYINEENSIDKERYRIGICQNSASGPTYNCEISNNYIIAAYRGIWIKDHRYASGIQSGITTVGSRPGAGYVIKDNIIECSKITDIRVDEFLTHRLDTGEYIGESYIINENNYTINTEDPINDTLYHSLKNEDNHALWIIDTEYEKNEKLTTVTIKSNRELQELEHWSLSEDRYSLSTNYYSQDDAVGYTAVDEKKEIKDVNDNKCLLELNSEIYIGNVENGYLPIIGNTPSGKILRVGYTDFNSSEKGEYEFVNSRYVLTEESRKNCTGDNVFLVLENIEKNDKIEIRLKPQKLSKNSDESGNEYFKLKLKKNVDDCFEILGGNNYEYPYNMPYSKEAFICETIKNNNTYKVCIRFNRYLFARCSNDFEISCNIENSKKLVENIFENDDVEDLEKWKKLSFAHIDILDKNEDIIQELIRNKNNIENEEVVQSNVIDKEVDLMIFMGQSNMVGHGDMNSDSEEKIYPVTDENGNTINKEFKLYEDTANKEVNARLVEMGEPFGLYQNYNEDGSVKNGSGSMVTALTNAYYKETGVPVIAISSAVGGKSIYKWWNEKTGEDIGLEDAKTKYKAAVEYLNENGYTIRNKYMIWDQGESDNGTQAILPRMTASHYEKYISESYKDKFKDLVNAMSQIEVNNEVCGIDKAFIIEIGYRYGSYASYDDIIEIQDEICEEEENVILASTANRALTLCKETIWNDEENRFEYEYMTRRDRLHYHQGTYNIVGYDAGKNIAYYSNNGAESKVTQYTIDKDNNKAVRGSMKITKLPTKTTYVKGENIDLDGLQITIEYENGDTAQIDSTDKKLLLGEYDNTKSGRQKIKLFYEEMQATIEVIFTSSLDNISLDIDEKEIFIDDNIIVNVSFNQPDTTENRFITWISSNENVASVNKVGKVVGVSEGEATITAIASNGQQASCRVTVKEELIINLKNYNEIQEDANKYIENIKPSTKIKDVLEQIQTNGTIEIYKGTQKITDEQAVIATGMRMKISLEEDFVEYTVVVIGDLNGNGEMEDVDLLRLARYKAGLDNILEGAYLHASNTYIDNNYGDDMDLLKMVRVLVGLDSL